MNTAIDRETLMASQRIDFIRTPGLQPDDPHLVRARQRFTGKYGLTQIEIARAAVA